MGWRRRQAMRPQSRDAAKTMAISRKMRECGVTQPRPGSEEIPRKCSTSGNPGSSESAAHICCVGFLFACRWRSTYKLHKAVNGSIIGGSRQSEEAFAVRKTAVSKIGDVEL